MLFGAAVGSVGALSIPAAPTSRVVDSASILSPVDRQRIESALAEWESESSNQLVVAIFPSLDDEDPADFSNRLFEAWRLGGVQRNNGVLLAIFLQERQVRIEVGYGLEGRLTDALSRRIIENEIAPRFRTKSYAEGIEAACEAIMRATRGEYEGEANRGNSFRAWGSILPIAAIIVLALLLSPPSSGTTYSSKGRRRSFRVGGVRFGGGIPWGGFTGGRGFRAGSGGGFSGGGGLSGGGGATGSW